jgi:hypothetical protein
MRRLRLPPHVPHAYNHADRSRRRSGLDLGHFSVNARQVIRKRRKSGTLMKSKSTANAIAALSAPVTTAAESGVMAIPAMAKADAISRSPTDDRMTQKLGREDHSRRRSRLV